ncbi:MAG: hypothetical protein JO118_06120 [Acetobacteraceae bacterium]|nr:hypothetical protein [Acetobacteraceae bacterium]
MIGAIPDPMWGRRATRARAGRANAARGSVERHARVCLAGPMAQHRFNPRSMGHYRSHSDYALARGLALRLGGAEVAEAWLRLWEAQVREDLAEGWPAVERLAAALLERGTVSGEEAGRLVLARAG